MSPTGACAVDSDGSRHERKEPRYAARLMYAGMGFPTSNWHSASAYVLQFLQRPRVSEASGNNAKAESTHLVSRLYSSPSKSGRSDKASWRASLADPLKRPMLIDSRNVAPVPHRAVG